MKGVGVRFSCEASRYAVSAADFSGPALCRGGAGGGGDPGGGDENIAAGVVAWTEPTANGVTGRRS